MELPPEFFEPMRPRMARAILNPLSEEELKLLEDWEQNGSPTWTIADVYTTSNPIRIMEC